VLDGLNEFGEPFEVANAFRILATSADSIHLTCFSRETSSIKDDFGTCAHLKLFTALLEWDIDKYLE